MNGYRHTSELLCQGSYPATEYAEFFDVEVDELLLEASGPSSLKEGGENHCMTDL